MSRLSIGLRLYAVVLIACAALIALIVYSGLAAGRAAMAQKQEELRHIAQSGVSIAAGFADKAKSGAMSEDEAKAAAASAIGAMRYGDGEYLWINDMGPRMVMHPIKPELNGKDLSTNADPNGKRLFVEFVNVVRADGAGVVDYLWPKPGQSEPVAKTSYVVGLPAWGWVIGTGVYIDKLEAAVWSRLQRDLAVGAALVALLLGAAFVLVRTVTRPLAAIGSAMGELSSGRNVEIPGLDRADEIGAMSRAVAVFRDASIERQKLAAAQDQSQTAAAERAVQVEAAVRGFRSEIQRLLGAVSRNAETLTGAAGDLASIAGSTADRAASSAHSSTEASASVGSVASAAEEMAASIQEIGRQVSRTTEVVGRAAESAERTNGTVQSLAEAAARIGDVVALIQAIAQQTNLLALNATIEAARAGEAGRGFAVVATEVKSLATQTAKATEDIGAQVAAIQGSTGEAVDAIQAITAIMREANGYAAAIAAAVEEQSAATAEISRSVQDAARSTSAVNDDIGAVAASTGEVTGSSRRVGSSAADLSDVVGQLQTSVDGFLRKVAA